MPWSLEVSLLEAESQEGEDEIDEHFTDRGCILDAKLDDVSRRFPANFSSTAQTG